MKSTLDNTHTWLAMQVIAFCAKYVDSTLDSKTSVVDTDIMIAAACKYFDITGVDYQKVFEMREG